MTPKRRGGCRRRRRRRDRRRCGRTDSRTTCRRGQSVEARSWFSVPNRRSTSTTAGDSVASPRDSSHGGRLLAAGNRIDRRRPSPRLGTALVLALAARLGRGAGPGLVAVALAQRARLGLAGAGPAVVSSHRPAAGARTSRRGSPVTLADICPQAKRQLPPRIRDSCGNAARTYWPLTPRP